MNDNWTKCPICYEEYSFSHRPTTFLCGHSTCLNHISGHNPLRECPICRYPLSQKNEYNVSYSLEEACRLFQAIKHHSDNSKIKFPKATVRTEQTVEKRPRPKDGNQVPNDTHGGLKNEDNKRHSAILSFILASSPSPKGKPSQGQQQTKHHDYTFNNTTSYYCTCSNPQPYSIYDQYNKYAGIRDLQQPEKRNPN